MWFVILFFCVFFYSKIPGANDRSSIRYRALLLRSGVKLFPNCLFWLFRLSENVGYFKINGVADGFYEDADDWVSISEVTDQRDRLEREQSNERANHSIWCRDD